MRTSGGACKHAHTQARTVACALARRCRADRLHSAQTDSIPQTNPPEVTPSMRRRPPPLRGRRRRLHRCCAARPTGASWRRRLPARSGAAEDGRALRRRQDRRRGSGPGGHGHGRTWREALGLDGPSALGPCGAVPGIPNSLRGTRYRRSTPASTRFRRAEAATAMSQSTASHRRAPSLGCACSSKAARPPARVARASRRGCPRSFAPARRRPTASADSGSPSG